MKTCIDCHGIELPHSRKFVAGYHAGFAYKDLDTCLKCHDLYQFCSDERCHNFRAGLVSADGLHRIGWQHSPIMQTHPSKPASYCAGCHIDPDVCRYCHADVPDH
jgi:Pyruvate/2-oxoacid:ferredoxin oxidoreductase delta subunit